MKWSSEFLNTETKRRLPLYRSLCNLCLQKRVFECVQMFIFKLSMNNFKVLSLCQQLVYLRVNEAGILMIKQFEYMVRTNRLVTVCKSTQIQQSYDDGYKVISAILPQIKLTNINENHLYEINKALFFITVIFGPTQPDTK